MNAQIQLKRILRDIREKTGVHVRLTPGEGEETRISLSCGGETMDAYLDGTGKEAERTAKLVAYLVANADARALLPDKEEHLRAVLLGEGGEWYAFRFATKYAVQGTSCFALDIVPDKRLPEAFELIAETRDLAVKMDRTRIAVVRFSDDEQSAFEFGQFVWQSLYEELGIHASIGIGCEVASFSAIAHSYSQAVTAVRVSNLFRDTGEVHSYREYLLVKMLEDVPKNRLEEYVEQFHIGNIDEVFGDEEMSATAEAFLESSLNISASALHAFGTGMMTTANAIANVNTDGFLPQRTVYGEMRGGGVRVESVVQEGGQPGRVQTAVERRAVTDAPSATELTREFPGMMTTQRAFEANAVAVRTADEMMGTLLDIRA